MHHKDEAGCKHCLSSARSPRGLPYFLGILWMRGNPQAGLFPCLTLSISVSCPSPVLLGSGIPSLSCVWTLLFSVLQGSLSWYCHLSRAKPLSWRILMARFRWLLYNGVSGPPFRLFVFSSVQVTWHLEQAHCLVLFCSEAVSPPPSQ